MTPKKWIDGVNAIGIISKAGKYNGGTYAHKDIALQFASWISPEINLYIIKEFQRLKADEQKQIGWTVKRELAKINYRIHTCLLYTSSASRFWILPSSGTSTRNTASFS